MNFRDSEFVLGILLDAGFSEAKTPEEADIIIVNTCSVRQHAEDRAASNIWAFRKLKEKKPGLLIGMIGCMAQAKREKAFKEIRVLDFICGPDDEPRLPGIIAGLLESRGTVSAVNSIGEERPELFPGHRNDALRALVSVSYGCNNYCSYCIVPYVRGKERSRKSADVLREVRDLIGRGYKEIILLGQNVNSYAGYGGKTGEDFVKLLKDIDSIDGDFRIRFVTSHPKDAHRALFEAMRGLKKVCGQLHLPLQSGSDGILGAMNRGYTFGAYRLLIDAYRESVKGGSLTTDIIVGFPGETGKDFEATVSALEAIRFDSSYFFKYSPREQAAASKLPDDVPAAEKDRRLRHLIALQNDIAGQLNRELVGSVQDVLVDGMNPKAAKQAGGHLPLLTGRTRTNKIVLFDGPKSVIGSFCRVKIEETTCSSLRGRVP